jgi:uncharacterized phage protein (TIGR02220 family)
VIEENDVAHDDWAKMDARLDTSPKIRKAGRNGREVFLFLLRRNRLLSGGGADGRVPASNIEPWYLAEQLMMSEADAVTGVGNAVTAGLIAVSGDFVTICGFNEEWGGKASLTPAEKQKAYRERGRAKRDAESVTEACNESNALPRREEKRREEDMSGKPDAPVLTLLPNEPERNPIAEAAEPVIELLNRLTGKRYEPDSSVVTDNVRKLLGAKFTAADMQAVVSAKVAEWRHRPEMADYLRPSTLLRPSKFKEYIADLRAKAAKRPAPSANTNTSASDWYPDRSDGVA